MVEPRKLSALSSRWPNRDAYSLKSVNSARASNIRIFYARALRFGNALLACGLDTYPNVTPSLDGKIKTNSVELV